MAVHLKFCGAAGTVTGSNLLVSHDHGRFLIDCGMFQGPKTVRELNYRDFPYDPAEIDFALLTHAHIDHSGLLPKLIRHGFSGPVIMLSGTRDLLSYMLPDSGYIQESEVEHLNRRNAQRGKPAVEPIYTRADAEAALQSFRGVEYGDWIEPGKGVRARFWNAGHILGAASIEVEVNDARGAPLRLLFSGDIGPEHKLFHPDPDAPTHLDYVVTEATYGGRSREAVTPDERRRRLAAEVNEALGDHGVLLIPAFAVERTQELLADLATLLDEGRVPKVPVFLDSPLAIRATEVFARHHHELEGMDGENGLFRNPCFHFSETVEQSKAIDRHPGGMIVLAASGMCDAGRIRHHLLRYLWEKRATVLMIGYQAPGTLGHLLQQGVNPVRIMGQEVKVRARIRSLDLYSGHADREQLLAWVKGRLPISKALFLTHGEATALDALRDGLIAAGMDADCILIPKLDDEVDLSAKRCRLGVGKGARRIKPESVDRPDWHNQLAQLTLDLRAELETAATDPERELLLKRMRRSLAKYR